MIRVSSLEISGDCSNWDHYVRDNDRASVFHLSAWGRSVHKSMKHDLYYLYAQREGNICGILPLVHIKSKLFGNSLVSVAFSVGGGPLYDDLEILNMLDAEAIKIADNLGVDVMEYRQVKKCHDDWPEKSQTYSTFRKTLSADNEENMLAIPRKQRAMVRKGIKFGLTYQIDEDVDRLYTLYSTSVRNLGTPVFPKSLFKELKAEFKDDCEILTVLSPDGEAISSVMSFYFKEEIVPYYGGGGLSARRYAANDFMYWSVMEHAVSERSVKLFDFGRSKNGTGAYSFKKNWGFEPTALEYEYYLREGDDIPEINPLNPKYQVMIKIWRKLPLPIANLIGPMIAKSLG
ncbi:MAG: FemAB family PEP-CTERM system-associated protein [Kordiimonadaceae bacterium]|nr:FemAB family PEP-CTERM system-associated protein [Kordiimonadaceae bacterium]MBT6036428.1 FemAB family PEP-CTERM system-associated protein [Kordiimonadaceae bacterium]MBT6330228.1 FemAB family PEP-CTERM system-associated protein [Kordiimonadaceae bacterium]